MATADDDAPAHEACMMYRLAKQRTFESGTAKTKATGTYLSLDSDPSPSLSFRASHDELRNPEARELLRQQLTGPAPETTSAPSPSPPRLGPRPSGELLDERKSLKGRISKTMRSDLAQPADVQSSSVAVDEAGVDRLSAVPEKADIDIEQAINLLQELKKLASPSELVALHRALLPTKDTEPADERSAAPSAARKRSVLPPGLATRGGAMGDVLRKPDDAQADTPRPKTAKSSKSARNDSWFCHNPAGSTSSLAALDLAGDGANYKDQPATPPDSAYSHIGAFQPGTLRITNGAALPERGTMSTLTAAAAREDMLPDAKHVLCSRATAIELMSDRPGKDARAVDEPFADLEKSGDWQSSAHSASATKKSSTPRLNHRQSVQSMGSSPMEPVPRFQQRLNHRRSHITEHLSDRTPIEASGRDSLAVVEIAARLSGIFDGRFYQNKDRDPNAHSTALALLSGMPIHANAPTPSSSTSSTSGRDAPPIPPKHCRCPNTPHQSDSGYCSNISPTILQSRSSSDHRYIIPASSGPPTSLVRVAEHVENRPLNTMSEMLEPITVVESDSPKTIKAPTASKSIAPFRQLCNMRRSTLSVKTDGTSYTSSDTGNSVTSLMAEQSSPTEAPISPVNVRTQKKLQKTIPPEVKYKRKLEAHRLRAIRLEGSSEMPPPSKSAVEFSSEDLEHSAELLGDGETPNKEKKGIVSRRRAKSLVRDRAKSVHQGSDSSQQQANMEQDPPKTDSSWSIARLRSKSVGKACARPKNNEDGTKNVATESATLSDERPESAPDTEKKRSTVINPVPRAQSLEVDLHGLSQFSNSTAAMAQSRIGAMSSSPMRVKHGGGMSEQAASEFARAKSRDRAGHDMAPMFDRPRMATPKQTRPSAPARTTSVEDFFPEWRSKADAPAELPAQRFSLYAESIPPLPELPSNAQARVYQAGTMTSTSSKSISPSSTQLPLHKIVEERGMIWPVPAKPTVVKSSSELPSTSTCAFQKIAELSGDESLCASPAPLEGRVDDAPTALGNAITSDREVERAESKSSPNWDQHGNKWRDQRVSMSDSLAKPVQLNGDGSAESRQASEASIVKAGSPSIVVSRHFTPLGDENKTRANAGHHSTDRASMHAEFYRDLLTDGKENSRLVSSEGLRTGSTLSSHGSGSFIAVSAFDNRSSYDPRHNSTFSAKSYQNPSGPTPVDRTAGGRVRTKSGTWMPYLPNRASQFEPLHFPHANISTSSPSPPSNCFNSEAIPGSQVPRASPTPSNTPASRTASGRMRTKSGTWMPYSPSRAFEAERSRRKSLAKTAGHNLLQDGGRNGNQASLLREPPRNDAESPTNRSAESLCDRYSGGMGYGWERGPGISASAGMRISGSALSASKATRKSGLMSEEFGLDLSDVPVMLRRIG